MSSPASPNTTSTNKGKEVVLADSDPTGGGGGSGRPSVKDARIKDGTSVSDPSAPTSPYRYIPPPMWGHVLDFMPYEEALSALFINKMVAKDAVKYVRTLNFMKGYQLDGPSARRFPSVEEVNCLCLISGNERSTILCKDTAIGLVPLLTTFAKLKQISLGGLVTKDAWYGQTQPVRRCYDRLHCSSPTNHRDLAKVLCQSFLGAFKTRMLSPALESGGDIAGLFHQLNVCRLLREVLEREGGECALPMCETCNEGNQTDDDDDDDSLSVDYIDFTALCAQDFEVLGSLAQMAAPATEQAAQGEE